MYSQGKLFCIVFTIIGIPYFAYMIGSLADLIGSAIDKFKKSLKLPSKVITYGYLISGSAFHIIDFTIAHFRHNADDCYSRQNLSICRGMDFSRRNLFHNHFTDGIFVIKIKLFI